MLDAETASVRLLIAILSRFDRRKLRLFPLLPSLKKLDELGSPPFQVLGIPYSPFHLPPKPGLVTIENRTARQRDSAVLILFCNKAPQLSAHSAEGVCSLLLSPLLLIQLLPPLLFPLLRSLALLLDLLSSLRLPLSRRLQQSCWLSLVHSAALLELLLILAFSLLCLLPLCLLLRFMRDHRRAPVPPTSESVSICNWNASVGEYLPNHLGAIESTSVEVTAAEVAVRR